MVPDLVYLPKLSNFNMTTNEQFTILLNANSEHEHLEFKEAKLQFNFDNGRHSILGYCTAIANERGGKLILGVTDKIPRKIVGTLAFNDTKKLERDIFRRFKRKVVVETLLHEGKRVLILHIPSRPIAEPLEFQGVYLTRAKDELLPMSQDQLKAIYNEAVADYSAEVHTKATIEDIDSLAIKILRTLLINSGRTDKPINDLNDKQLLTDLNLIQEGDVTIAALVLLAKESSLARLLPFVEIKYGYKTDFAEMRNQDTVIYRKGYLLCYDELWQKVDSRNLTLNIQQGLLITEKKTFAEESIREAINNAVIHRDYDEKESIMVTQTQKDFMISSPGGLPEGVTLNNMIDRSKPRMWIR